MPPASMLTQRSCNSCKGVHMLTAPGSWASRVRVFFGSPLANINPLLYTSPPHLSSLSAIPWPAPARLAPSFRHVGTRSKCVKFRHAVCVPDNRPAKKLQTKLGNQMPCAVALPSHRQGLMNVPYPVCFLVRIRLKPVRLLIVRCMYGLSASA
eukprot:1195151-Prorocentrum_minimum.AAC.6